MCVFLVGPAHVFLENGERSKLARVLSMINVSVLEVAGLPLFNIGLRAKDRHLKVKSSSKVRDFEYSKDGSILRVAFGWDGSQIQPQG